jgi:hypothetical protein
LILQFNLLPTAQNTETTTNISAVFVSSRTTPNNPPQPVITTTLAKHRELAEVLKHCEVHMDNCVLEMMIGLGTSMYTSALEKCKCKTSSTIQRLSI